jgi:large subunit ribosomal protein L9
VKVVFLEDVPGVAGAGEIREVADGYGRNYLVPRKLVVVADASASQIAEARLRSKARKQMQFEAEMKEFAKQLESKEMQFEAEMKEFAKQLESKEITLKARTGTKDRLYGSITSADIASGLADIGVDVDKRKIDLDEPIRELGSYQVTIKLTGDIAPGIKVNVVEEEEKKAVAEEDKKPGKKAKKAEKKEDVKVEGEAEEVKEADVTEEEGKEEAEKEET